MQPAASDDTDRLHDCVIVGGGPAGLTAAIYLARFHLSVVVIDDSRSRARMIPISHNHAGYPNGIEGAVLVDRMTEQARKYGARHSVGTVTKLARDDGAFVCTTDTGSLWGRTVLLATGVWNRRPEMPGDQHDDAVARGLLRYCPVCDGFEVTDRAVAVIGPADTGLGEAEFLRSFTADVTLIDPNGSHALDDEQRARVETAGIRLLDGPCRAYELLKDRIAVTVPSGKYAFTSAYPALGSDIRSALAVELGAEASPDGGVLVDTKQRTAVPGLYAAGDVTHGLDQISYAMGQAAVAATAIRNDLCAIEFLTR